MMRVPDNELEWRFTGSGGPGGQHANTANTRVEVVFDIAGSPSLGESTRQRLLEVFGPRLRVVCTTTRSQSRNRELARAQLEQRLTAALATTTVRRPTRPGRGANERRLTAKRRHSQTKQGRRWQSRGDHEH
jgi:ribosome-associated protein